MICSSSTINNHYYDCCSKFISGASHVLQLLIIKRCPGTRTIPYRASRNKISQIYCPVELIYNRFHCGLYMYCTLYKYTYVYDYLYKHIICPLRWRRLTDSMSNATQWSVIYVTLRGELLAQLCWWPFKCPRALGSPTQDWNKGTLDAGPDTIPCHDAQ